jgi:hypothetical protein
MAVSALASVAQPYCGCASGESAMPSGDGRQHGRQSGRGRATILARGVGASARRARASNMRENGVGEHPDAARRTAALMGFIVILVLAIAGVVLVRELAKNASLEDCLMAGRRNCAPIEVPARP